MASPRRVRPTEAEISILQVLWQRGPCTVRDVYEVLAKKRSVGYTTALKLMQIMTVKGLVVRDERRRSHVYKATRGEEETQTQLVRDLLNRAFGGSARKLVMQALAVQKSSPEDLEKIRAMLDQFEEKNQ